MTKTRLDLFLVEKGLAESRSSAQRMIMAGTVRINGQVVLKAAGNVIDGDEVTVDQPPRFVSRG